MNNQKHDLIRSQSGQGLTEYMILIMLIAIVSIGVTKGLGENVQNRIEHAKKKIGDIEMK